MNGSLETGLIFRVSPSAGVAGHHLQPELYRQAAQAYRCAGYSMSEPLHDAQPDEIHPCAYEKNHPNHGCNCRCSENARDDYHAEPAARGGRIHQRWDQNLTRPKNKNHEQRPGCNAHLVPAIVNVSVLLIVTMLVRMA